MSTRGAPDSWLGTSGEWGLTRKKHAELCDELSDHVSEMARMESHGAAQDAKETLSQPKVRRKLAGVHLADQVYATLNRLPNKQEWRELMWLGVWFVLVLLGDWLAIKAEHAVAAYDWSTWDEWVYSGTAQFNTPSSIIIPTTLAWLLQGISRAGFFTCMALTLYRAWQMGLGILLGRILQLKLVHTLLVIAGAMLLGNQLEEMSWLILVHTVDWPTWLIAPVLVSPIVITAIAVLVISKKKAWGLSLGLALAAVFLYPSGPSLMEHKKVERPIAYARVDASDWNGEIVPSTDQVYIQELAETWVRVMNVESVDVANNLMVERVSLPKYMFGHGVSWRDFSDGITSESSIYGRFWYDYNEDYRYEQYELGRIVYKQSQTLAPVAFPGSGLGWLSAAIPPLGLIGLLGLLFVMGRRGIFEFLAYTGIAFCSFLFTVLPAVVIDFSPRALVKMPFEYLRALIVLNDYQEYSLVFAFALSAGAPWLLTWLFLKPGRTEKQVDDIDHMQEAGA